MTINSEVGIAAARVIPFEVGTRLSKEFETNRQAPFAAAEQTAVGEGTETVVAVVKDPKIAVVRADPEVDVAADDGRLQGRHSVRPFQCPSSPGELGHHRDVAATRAATQ